MAIELIKNSLEDIKAQDITILEVAELTDMMDQMIICTATSTTHCSAIAKNLEMDLKKNKISILGIEGEKKSDWVLVDTGDVVVHIMLAETRELYSLEKLWDISKKVRS